MIPFIPIPKIVSVTPMTTGVFYALPCRCHARRNHDGSLTPMYCPEHFLAGTRRP